MGNRAIVIFSDKDRTEFSPAVYLHWNGGPESVYQFLDELDRRKIRGGDDLSYQSARFVHVVADFMDQDEATGLSLGIFNGPESLEAEALEPFQQGDNGIYVVYRGGGERQVWRFGPDGEWGVDSVEQEYRMALKSDYYTKDGGFRTLFEEQRPKISQHG